MGSTMSASEAPNPAWDSFWENKRIFETRSFEKYEYHYNGSTGLFRYSTGEYCKK